MKIALDTAYLPEGQNECILENRNQTVECQIHEHCTYLELQAVELCQYFIVIKNSLEPWVFSNSF